MKKALTIIALALAVFTAGAFAQDFEDEQMSFEQVLEADAQARQLAAIRKASRIFNPQKNSATTPISVKPKLMAIVMPSAGPLSLSMSSSGRSTNA